MTNEVLLEARGICRHFGATQVLRGIDLELRRGDILGFLGLNGQGKTTTLEILAGARAASRGCVTIAGHELARAPREARRACGYLAQGSACRGDARVGEALALSARLGGVERSAVADAVGRAAARCGLGDVRTRLVEHLSAGYRQRLGIACAIVHDPEVVLLDEPGSALDPAQTRDLRRLIAELGRDRAVLFSTHVLAEVQALATRVAVLHEGRIVHDAPLDGEASRVRLNLRQRPDQAAIAAIEGVSAVKPLDTAGSYVVTLEAGDAELARFAAEVVGRDWGLLALEPGYDPLEARFLALTSSPPA